jgi:signal transduction histidine kinase
VAARAVRRQLELQQERATELEMFAARVAHDVMSPLTGVSLGLELAREQIPDERVAAMSARLLGTVKRVTKIVDGLYEFARAGGRPSASGRAAAHEVVPDVCEEVRANAERQNIELCCRPVSPCEVACTPGVLTVLLANLINNAIKFMGESRVRRITVETEDGSEVVRFVVRDTGPGLPPGFETVAFQPYRRGRSDVPGLGLGLATVKRLVEAHRGRVGIGRGADAGTTCWFELPRATVATRTLVKP